MSCNPSPERSGPSESAQRFLPPRQEVIAQADRLATAAEREKGSLASTQLLEAARLRERLWRLEGKVTDGLEAVELLTNASKAGSCSSVLARHALRAEVENRPEFAAQELLGLIGTEQDSECQRTARKLLAVYAVNSSLRPPKENASDAERPPSNPNSELIVPIVTNASDRASPRVTAVHRYGAKDSARIVVALSHPATFRASLLRAEDGGGAARLYVDIDRAEIPKSEMHEVGGLVQRVRLGQRTDGVRLVLDLEEPADRRIFYMPEPFRLVIDVARGKRGAVVPNHGPRLIERVVIDPGHGGHDPGAIGPRGLREKDVTLDIAHRAAPLIARELGVSTLLTRDNDTFVPLDERTARANAFKADLFVSIHCNAADKSGSDGVMTFVLDSSSDAAASKMAALENSASDAAAKELASSLGSALDEGMLARSLHFADLLQRATIASLGPHYGPIANQGVRRAGFYVLAGAHMPAVLYEVSFISNPNGEVRLNTADYRQKLADSLVNAVRAYRDGL